MKIRTSFLLILAVVTVLLAGTSVIGFSLYEDSVVDQHHREVETQSDSIASALESQIRDNRRKVQLWARNPVFAGGNRTQQYDQLRLFVYSTVFEQAMLVDTDGTVRAVSAEGLSPDERAQLHNSSVTDRPGVRQALTGSVTVTDQSSEKRGHTITVSAPVRRNGSVRAVLVADIDLSTSNLLSQIRRTHASRNAVRIRDSNETLYSVGFDDQTNYVTATATTQSVGWTVTAGKERAAVSQATRPLQYMRAASVGFVLAVLAAFGLWLYRRIISQLTGLQAGLESLESGDYDIDIRLGGASEWQAIGAQLHAVADALNRRESQIRVLNRVLRHNLRNAMTVIKSESAKITRQTTAAELTKPAGHIDTKADDLLEIADHARAVEEELARSISDREPGNAAAIVQDRVDVLRAEYPDATIEVDRPDSAWVKSGHIVSLVVDELCRNALKHNSQPEKDRTVEISVTVREAEVTITVADNGPGLPEVEHNLLTGEVEETPVYHGSGLGLWLVQWLVDAADGTATAETDDHGTSITVTLPPYRPAESSGP